MIAAVAALVAAATVVVVLGHRGSAPRPFPDAFKVAGSGLVGPTGHAIQLLGVGRSGTEYECLAGKSVFDGPIDVDSVESIASWDVNEVRLPLNEDCWLGINGVPPATSGQPYQRALAAYIRLLRNADIGVILDLHWSAPGTEKATGQKPMPDATHADAFWAQVAHAYANVPGVTFELYNEPDGVSWSCWADGCPVPPGPGYPGYQAVGMQALIQTVRGTGADNPIIVDGLAKASSFSGWSTHLLHDPDGQLIAGWHLYGPNQCTISCWNNTLREIGSTPVIVTEFGATDCGVDFVNAAMTWLDAHRISYLAWAWDTWGSCGGPTLIDNYDGTPQPGYGQDIRDHFVAHRTP